MLWAVLALGVLVLAGGCIPATQQEVQTLTNTVEQIVPAVREAVSTSSEETRDKVEIVLGQVEEVNEAVATAEDPIEAIEKGWGATKDFNPYYGWGALGIALVKMVMDDKKKKNLEKGINRVKGEATPEVAKQIHETIKQYTG